MFDINEELVNVDVKPSTYPIKGISKSKLQTVVAEILTEKFPREPILEEFIIPGSRMSVDFFLPLKQIVVEIDGRQHQEFTPFFHGDKATSNKFANQIKNDRQKTYWCEINKYKLIRIIDKKDLEQLNGEL